jgi:alpha-beta hydrolase superfamily lysophospholipase
MAETLLRFRARDGFVVRAHMVTVDGAGGDAPVLLQIHGSLGHFLARGTPRLLPHALGVRGIHSLSVNTRLASMGQMTGAGILDDTRWDLDAAVEVLAGKGFRNIFVLGYSLGAAMVVHWAAGDVHPDVRALVLEGVSHSIPDSHRRRCNAWGSTPSYDDLHVRARAVLGADPYKSPDDQTLVIFGSRGPSRAPEHSEIFTYRTWWHMIGPEASPAMAYRHIDRIRLPILMIRGEHDQLVEAWEPAALAGLAREAGNARIRVATIPGAGHDCMENADRMLQEIGDWLAAHARRPGGIPDPAPTGAR